MTDLPIRRRALAVVAEDEPLMRMEAADMLRDAGFEVDEAFHAAGALTQLEAHGGVSLLFTDINMPGPSQLDGLDLAREVARRWPNTVIVICSGARRPEPSEMPAGAQFFDKPYMPSALLKTVREMTAEH